MHKRGMDELEKLTKLRKELEARKLDAILITNPINRRYLTGFTGTAGIVIVSKNAASLITDFRYIEQAAEQAEAFTVVEHKKSIEHEIKHQLEKLNVTNVGFEKDQLTYAQYELYHDLLDVELVPVSGIVEQLRHIKTTDELAVLKKAADIADAAIIYIQNYIKTYVKDKDIYNELEFFNRKQGATSSSFDIIVASGIRSALPHGVASAKEIQNGELVTLDYGALYEGYCSDITRTVAVGEIDNELTNIYETVLEAQLLGVGGI